MTKTTKTTDKSESPVTVFSADLQIIEKAGQAANARKAVQAYQRACSDYGALIAKCGKAKHVNSSLSRKSGTVKELSELDCSTLEKSEVKRLSDCIRIKKAWMLLSGEFWYISPRSIMGRGETTKAIISNGFSGFPEKEIS